MRTDAFDYPLADDAIAQVPCEPRDAARLLVHDHHGAPRDLTVADLASLVRPGDLLVVNDSRVLPARVAVTRSTGGGGEVLLLERGEDGWWEALVRPSARTAAGSVVSSVGELDIEVGADLGDGRRRVRLFRRSDPAGALTDVQELELLDSVGEPPLPPYLTQGIAEPERYQTVYSRRPSSAAAPTAGLHLTERVFDEVRRAGGAVARVELAVGLDTFRPLRGERLDDHVMHTEWYSVPPETEAAVVQAERVIAVGTTVVRTLESWAATGDVTGRTNLFLKPGARFAVVDALMTNFHFPRSTLLVLLEAFMGAGWRDLYATAAERGYRFLSLGDAMFVERREP
jgi:S-adenosylmethionine:tRNA ribosyltransferase-isomerase